MRDLGETLRQHRRAAGLSLRRLAELTAYDFGYLGQIERGDRPATAAVVVAYDRALSAGGALETAFQTRHEGDRDVRRRSVLQAMGTLAAAPTTDRLVDWEALRHGLGTAVGVGVDEWAEIVTDYGRGYYRHPRDQLMAQLGRDLRLLQLQIATDADRRSLLLRAAARLSVVVALSLNACGQVVLAGRWRASARRAADESGDAETRVLTGAWDVVNGCYDGRSPAAVIARADQLLPLANGKPSAATCGLLAGRAQALSLAGRHTEAVASVRALADKVDALSASVTADVESLWAWPEHRLRHTESWVYAHAGQRRAAEAAQQRALELYPPSQQRLRAQVRLHQAAALCRDGHIPEGLHLAADLLDQLPADQHNELVRAVARQVVAAVPPIERYRAVYGELVERVRE
ncbi:helix-turn-helix transcriptional regulator [Micromonospora sp. WMMD1120]|uniref:helix-turn-helix domain-containing protein n=1 Tax=Micromonospora sp. WMMD1120 TaxID=3016106 RepID=UPI002416B378|nr:helix-turn-helix transcriptional regulator [Micromonospora sp. WMMD1120]MDG4810455.1 helix-turn-helix transcriptional regulator [Micromonospora sp. WMMD1120]